MLVLRVGVEVPMGTLAAVKAVAERFPGGREVVILVVSGGGSRRIKLGGQWRVDGSRSCRAALSEFGDVL